MFQHLLPAALGQEIDWSTLRLESSAFVDKGNLGARQGDLLFSAQLRAAPAYTIFLSAEHQSNQRDGWNLPFRLLRYLMDHWSRLQSNLSDDADMDEDYASDEPRRTKSLPAVVSVVVHHGKSK